MRITCLALMTAALLTACSERPAPTYRGAEANLLYAVPGTKIELANLANGTASETRITVAAPQGARGTYIGADGQQGAFYPGCWGCGTGMTIEEAKYAQLWPLETGKQVVFLRTAPDGQKARVQIQVAGTEDVTTPAGTFEAWILDGRIETISGPRYSAQVRAWWAPNPGWVVKAEGGDSQGNTLSSQVAVLDQP